MSGATGGGAAIVGVAESDLGIVASGMSATDLMAQATQRALDDCGLALKDIDAVFAATVQARMASLSLCEYLRIAPRIQDATNVGGSSFMFHLAHAHAALEAKMCDVALIAYGSTQRSVGRANLSAPEHNPYESPFRPVLPVTGYALAASRHMAEFGTTREQLAEVAVAARSWALMNPAAFEKQPLTIAEVLASRMVSDPLTVRDCCLVTDGGGAVILTRPRRICRFRRCLISP
jgi:acetyl-CoA acetyltransferase